MPKLKVDSITIDPDRTRKSLDKIDELAASIRKFGLLHPITVERGTNRLIAGERRLRAHMVLEKTTIDARYLDDLDEFQLKEIELEENLQREQLSWQDEVAARKELHDLKQKLYGESVSGREGGWTLEDTAGELGLDKSSMSLDMMLASALEQFPEAMKNIPSKKKALEVLKAARERDILRELSERRIDPSDTTEIRMINGDCLDEITKITDASIDLAIVDPPFGIGDDMLGAGGKKIDFRNDPDHCLNLYARLIPELYRVMKPGTHTYLFIAIQFNQTIRDMCENIILDEKASQKEDFDVYEGFVVRPMPLIWVKETAHKADPDWKIPTRYEAALWLQKLPFRPLNFSVDDVFQVPREASTKRIHPMERPRELMKQWIEVSSNPGDLILDPFSGSAVVPHMCFLLDRKCISIELNETIYNRGVLRLTELREEVLAQELKEKKEAEKIAKAEKKRKKDEQELTSEAEAELTQFLETHDGLADLIQGN